MVPKLFVCRHRKLVEQISWHTSHANLFQSMASGITGDSENGNDLFFTFFWRSPLLWAKIFGNLLMQPKMMLISKRSHYLSGRNLQCHPRLTAVVGPYFMAAFPRFWQKICINLKHFKKTRGKRAKCPRRTVWETLPLLYFVLFVYLSSIHEKANCIAILWTGSPHSLGRNRLK